METDGTLKGVIGKGLMKRPLQSGGQSERSQEKLVKQQQEAFTHPEEQGEAPEPGGS